MFNQAQHLLCRLWNGLKKEHTATPKRITQCLDLQPSNWFFYKEAYDMDMFKVVDMIATIQQHVDQGISFTLFLKDTMTTRVI
jgi:ribonucleotide reductase alpha subunit